MMQKGNGGGSKRGAGAKAMVREGQAAEVRPLPLEGTQALTVWARWQKRGVSWAEACSLHSSPPFKTLLGGFCGGSPRRCRRERGAPRDACNCSPSTAPLCVRDFRPTAAVSQGSAVTAVTLQPFRPGQLLGMCLWRSQTAQRADVLWRPLGAFY